MSNVRKLEWFALLPPEGTERPAMGFPALIYLHGSGAFKFNPEQLRADPFYDTFEPLQARGCVVVVPSSDREWDPAEVLEVVQRALTELPIDPDRVTLAGHSKGGVGTFDTVEQAGAPSPFAAAVPVCALEPPEPARAPHLAHLPIWCVYGEHDRPDALEANQTLADTINEAGGEATFTLLPEANHMQSRNRFFASDRFHEWVMRRSR